MGTNVIKIIGSLILILNLFNMYTYATKISFQLYGKSICNDSVFLIDFYYLEQVSSGKKIQVLDSTVCLPDTGEYKLQTMFLDPRDSITVKINNIGLNSDTIVVMSVYEIIPVDFITNETWQCCDTTCQGYYIDYYNNGNKRIEGRFKNGRPVGKIIYYGIDGVVIYIDYYNKRGKLIKSEKFD